MCDIQNVQACVIFALGISYHMKKDEKAEKSFIGSLKMVVLE